MGARGLGSVISATTILGGTGAAALAAGGLAAATGGIALPIIGIALIFLPEILGGLFKGANAQKQREAIRSKLAGEIIPGIKRKLRDEIPNYLNPHITAMAAQVREQYRQGLEEHKAQINQSIEEKKAGAEDREKERKELETARANVLSLTNEILSWGALA